MRICRVCAFSWALISRPWLELRCKLHHTTRRGDTFLLIDRFRPAAANIKGGQEKSLWLGWNDYHYHSLTDFASSAIKNRSRPAACAFIIPGGYIVIWMCVCHYITSISFGVDNRRPRAHQTHKHTQIAASVFLRSHPSCDQRGENLLFLLMRAPQLIYASGLLTKKVSGVDAVILFIKGSLAAPITSRTRRPRLN